MVGQQGQALSKSGLGMEIASYEVPKDEGEGGYKDDISDDSSVLPSVSISPPPSAARTMERKVLAHP